MQCPATNTISLGPWWGKEEQTTFMHVPLMTWIEVSHNFGIHASEDNPALGVQVDGNNNIFPTQADCKP